MADGIIKIKLAVDRARNRVLFADAGSDFVDVLLSFSDAPNVRRASRRGRVVARLPLDPLPGRELPQGKQAAEVRRVPRHASPASA